VANLNELNVSKLILPGSLISLRIGDELIWSLNIVVNCTDKSLDIPLTYDLMKSCPSTDNHITIKYTDELFEYIIHGTISKIELCSSPFMTIDVIDILGSNNNRIFPRYYVYIPAIISLDINTSYFCTVENISLGGISFVLNKPLPTAIECEVNIFLDDTNSVFSKGIILRCSEKGALHEYSMQFTFMEEEDSNYLYSFLNSIDKQYDYLRGKYLVPTIIR
jgi:hypothetical protein